MQSLPILRPLNPNPFNDIHSDTEEQYERLF